MDVDPFATGGYVQSDSFLLTDANPTTVLTCPAHFWYYIVWINVCASGGSAGTCDVIKYDDSLTRTIYLKYQSIVPAVGSLDAVTGLGGRPWLVLEPADLLQIRGADDQHVLVTYMVEKASV